MSGFLANLARRGAGLPPVTQDRASLVGARGSDLGVGNLENAASGPADADGSKADMVDGLAQVDRAPVASAPAPAAAPATPQQPAIPTVMAPDSRSVSAGPAAHVTSVTTPLVQRFVMPVTAPPSSSPVGPPSSPPASSPAAALVQPGTMTPAVPAPPAVPPVQPREDTRGLLRFPFAIRPAPEEPSVVAQPAAAATPTVDVERAVAPSLQSAHTIERVVSETRLVEPMRSAALAAPAMSRDSSAPSAVAAARVAPPARDAEAPAERVVQVRIGAIEIHGAAPAPPAAPASPLAAGASQLSSPGDFDRYAALRTYAAWEW